jgi:hypothetical protein
MDKFSSNVYRVHMELGGKLLISLRTKTQFLERLQSVSVVHGAARTQKDDVESNGGSLENVAKVSVLFLCGVQLVLRSGVLTVLDLNEVDFTPSFVEVFRSLLSGVGGCTGGWRCCWGAPSLPELPPSTSKNPSPYISLFFCVFAAMGVNSTKSGRLEVNLSLTGKQGGKSHLGTILLSAISGIWRFCMVIRSLLPISMETTHDPKEPVLLIALRIIWHAKLCLSVIMFLICVCWHPERM